MPEEDIREQAEIVVTERPVPGGKVVWAVVGTAPRVHRSIQVTCAR